MGIKKTDTDRRAFIEKLALIAGGFVAVSFINPIGSFLFAAVKRPEKGPWYGMGIDITKCIGCGNCVKACKQENHVPEEPFFFRTWVEQYTIKKDESIVVESPNGGSDGFKQTVADEEIFRSFFVPKLCNQCAHSPCVQVCPVGATFESPEGVVLVDNQYCLGCRYCIQACPYGTRFINPVTNVVDKCTLCYHRIMKGQTTACTLVCPTGSRIFGDLNDEESELYAFLKENITHVLKAHLNTGSKVYYKNLSPHVH